MLSHKSAETITLLCAPTNIPANEASSGLEEFPLCLGVVGVDRKGVASLKCDQVSWGVCLMTEHGMWLLTLGLDF